MILVTGASGFIGKALCSSLSERGLSYRTMVRQVHKSIEHQAEQCVCENLDGATDFSKCLENVDVVVHLAARVHQFGESADVYRMVNCDATVNLAEQSAAAGVKRFIFVSSIKVNGEGRARPYTENDSPAPGDAYARSKLQAEQGLLEISRKTGLEIVILRIPLVYGPGVKANFLRLLNLVHRGVPLPLGLVDNARSLIGLENLVDAIIVSIDHPGAVNYVFLLSDGEDLSTPVLLQKLAFALGKPTRVWPFPIGILEVLVNLTGKQQHWNKLTGTLTVDSSLFRKRLNWSPPLTTNQQLSETAKWYLDSRHLD